MIATSQPTTQKLSLTEYLAYADGSDSRYELVQGDLIPMSLGTGKHGAISEFLSDMFRAHIRQQGLPWTAKQMTVGIHSPRAGRWETSRIPDVTVLTVAQWQSLSDREAVIDYEDPAPLLVVEVVSPSTRTTDYRAKRTEYAVRDIQEYWIVDPIIGSVTVCLLDNRLYDVVEHKGSQRIQSGVFPHLELTAEQIIGTGSELSDP